jgi:hypothetical protein
VTISDAGIDINAVVAVVLAVGGGFAAQHSKAIKAENQALRDANQVLSDEIDALRAQHKDDVRRIDGVHIEIWTELKCQRENQAQNREDTVRLTSCIDRLNEIMTKIDRRLDDTVSRNECNLLRRDYNTGVNGGRRWTDVRSEEDPI